MTTRLLPATGPPQRASPRARARTEARQGGGWSTGSGLGDPSYAYPGELPAEGPLDGGERGFILPARQIKGIVEAAGERPKDDFPPNRGQSFEAHSAGGSSKPEGEINLGEDRCYLACQRKPCRQDVLPADEVTRSRLCPHDMRRPRFRPL